MNTTTKETTKKNNVKTIYMKNSMGLITSGSTEV
jgi:hypothetical protein